MKRASRRAVALLAAGVIAAAITDCTAPPAPRAAGPELKRVLGPPGMALEHACTPSGPELCFNATDDNCNGLLEEGCGVRSGIVQFIIAWTEASADVDLLVLDPKGELAEAGRVTDSGLTKEKDCPGERNQCFGQNFENVFLEEGEAPRGAYRARVRLEKLGNAVPPVRVRFGARIGPKTYAAALELKAAEEEQEIVLEL